ncbi:septation regulator SpoVG [Staphylococcus massiliensis]|uniref:Putative septation protein SpoVG n=1 Tax=Staphylococcus massiliensis S46 TaxID=1229783 RepID=K9AFQ7_9STAP|nr:septation regulator SpoVG [Staphylococcus massiliensis]EKU46154.1 regulatory protein SpoVG [Staphylococcus massiliensis S46]MCG3400535.1 septation regulator SpoVG [Staphylococcus massiliensis]MCG3402807.1 septation regulator SpoVG [Staphylococcus massiliensis]MCG3413204.1 septation regulator SpoVG [Staphylococcus massiliensis]POA01955.1 septation protein SpoVG [Staphylococcus massiliensis CCUG 55927]
MKVTDVRLRKIQTDGRMKALVSITLEESFVIHDLRVIEGNSGLFVAMPSKRTPDGEFRDIAHPINSDMRQEIQDAVMKVYDETDEVIPGKSNQQESESKEDDTEEEA